MVKQLIIVILILIISFVQCTSESTPASCDVYYSVNNDVDKLTVCEDVIVYEREKIDDFTGEVWMQRDSFDLVEVQADATGSGIMIVRHRDSIYSALYFIKKQVGNKEVLYIDDYGLEHRNYLVAKSLSDLKDTIMQYESLREIHDYGPPVNMEITFLKRDLKSKSGIQGVYSHSNIPCMSLDLTDKHITFIYNNCKGSEGKTENIYMIKEVFELDKKFAYSEKIKGYILENASTDLSVVFLRFVDVRGVSVVYSTVPQNIGDCETKDCIVEKLGANNNSDICVHCFGHFPFIGQD